MMMTMSGLETRAARNVAIVATAKTSWPESGGQFYERERLSPNAQSTCLLHLDEVGVSRSVDEYDESDRSNHPLSDATMLPYSSSLLGSLPLTFLTRRSQRTEFLRPCPR